MPTAKAQPTLLQQAQGGFGKLLSSISGVGSALHAPVNLGLGQIGNSLQSLGGQIAKPAYAAGPSVLGSSTSGTPMTPAEQQARSVAQAYPSGGPSNPTPTYAPSTGGQAAAPTGGGAPTQSSSSGGGFGDLLGSSFDSAKSALQGIIPTYDADFSNYQNQVNNSINQAQGARDQQVGDTTQRYGQALKQLLQNSSDLKQRTQSTFSGLGALDSSAFGDELLKQQQNDANNTANLSSQQNKDVTGINSTFDTYKQNQLAGINSYQQEINRAKQGVQQAIANNDVSKAQDLANYATNLQNTINGFASNLASAQAAGTDVIGNLKKINGSDFLNSFGQLLSGQYNNGLSRYVTPNSSATGQGYIGSANGLSDQQKKLLGLA